MTGMQESHDTLQQHQQVAADRQPRGLVLAVQARLGDLQVPVADLVPHEAVQHPRRLGEVVGVVEAGDLVDDRSQDG